MKVKQFVYERNSAVRSPKAYIKYHTDNDKWLFLLNDDKQIMSFDTVDQAENYLYLNHRDEPDHYMIVTFD